MAASSDQWGGQASPGRACVGMLPLSPLSRGSTQPASCHGHARPGSARTSWPTPTTTSRTEPPCKATPPPRAPRARALHQLPRDLEAPEEEAASPIYPPPALPPGSAHQDSFDRRVFSEENSSSSVLSRPPRSCARLQLLEAMLTAEPHHTKLAATNT